MKIIQTTINMQTADNKKKKSHKKTEKSSNPWENGKNTAENTSIQMFDFHPHLSDKMAFGVFAGHMSTINRHQIHYIARILITAGLTASFNHLIYCCCF